MDAWQRPAPVLPENPVMVRLVPRHRITKNVFPVCLFSRSCCVGGNFDVWVKGLRFKHSAYSPDALHMQISSKMRSKGPDTCDRQEDNAKTKTDCWARVFSTCSRQGSPPAGERGPNGMAPWASRRGSRPARVSSTARSPEAEPPLGHRVVALLAPPQVSHGRT